MDDRSEAGDRFLESTIFPASSGRFTFFSGGEFLTEIKHLQGVQDKKTEIFDAPEMKTMEYNNIRHKLNDQKTLCWKNIVSSAAFEIGRLASSSSLLPGCTSFVRVSGRCRKMISPKVSTFFWSEQFNMFLWF